MWHFIKYIYTSLYCVNLKVYDSSNPSMYQIKIPNRWDINRYLQCFITTWIRFMTSPCIILFPMRGISLYLVSVSIPKLHPYFSLNVKSALTKSLCDVKLIIIATYSDTNWTVIGIDRNKWWYTFLIISFYKYSTPLV